VIFEVLTAVRMMSPSIALMMEAASTSKTSVTYQTTRRNNPEDSHLRIRRHEYLKSKSDDLFENVMSNLHSMYRIHMMLNVTYILIRMNIVCNKSYMIYILCVCLP
jgi:hypothetical protein